MSKNTYKNYVISECKINAEDVLLRKYVAIYYTLSNRM